MTISSVGGGNFFGVNPVINSSAASVSSADSAAGGAAAPQGTSARSQFLGKLQALEQSDPAAAKQLLTDLANKFRTEGANGDSRKAALADALQKAADTGDLSSLFKPDSGGGHGWSRGAHAYSQTMAVTRASM